MFHWVQTVQRSRDYDYFPALKRFVDTGRYASDSSFIDMVNTMLRGRPKDVALRTKVFFDALRSFNLIEVENNSTETPVLAYCALGWDGRGGCTPCVTNKDCSGLELCYADLKACIPTDPPSVNPTLAPVSTPAPVPTLAVNDNVVGTNATDSNPQADSPGVAAEAPLTPLTMTAMTMSLTSATNNFCGTTWSDAAENCISACECN